MAPSRIFADSGASPLGHRERRPLNLDAYVTRADGTHSKVTVVDLSNDGCGIISTVDLIVGERIEISAMGRGKVGAIVRWVDGARVGVSFDGAAVRGLEQQPRQHERVSVRGEIAMRRAGKLAFRVNIYDLSPDGCKAELVERPGIGEQLWVKFDGMEALEAKVRWIVGPKVGIRFARPLHAAVFDLLIAKLRAAA